MSQFELAGTSVGRHPEAPRFYERGEGSRGVRISCALDPSLRLKNGFAQDDAVEADKIQT